MTQEILMTLMNERRIYKSENETKYKEVQKEIK